MEMETHTARRPLLRLRRLRERDPAEVAEAPPAKRLRRLSNDRDPITLERIEDIDGSALEIIADSGGHWAFRAESLDAIEAYARQESAPALNPFTSELLLRRGGRARVLPDPLLERAIPTWWSSRRLIVDVCVRLQQQGVFVNVELLQNQRTGRMRALLDALLDLFHNNMREDEQKALAPPAGRLALYPRSDDGWSVWAQASMLACARCAGERSQASPLLRKRGAELCLAAMSEVIPEIGSELHGRVWVDR